MRAISLRKMLIAVVILGIVTGYVEADRQELLRDLGRNEAEFEFKDVTIAEALHDIGQDLGVKIVLSDEAQWKLPQGEITRLSASLQGSLSDCLTEMLNPFFMRYAVSDDEITIYPRAELEHILGRPGTKQLELLKNMFSIKISYDGSYTDEQIKVFIGEVLADISFLPYDVPRRISEIIERNSTDKGIKGVSLAVLLEQVCDSMKCSTWYISGMDFPNKSPLIKFVGDREYREAVLDQVIDISFEGKRSDRAIVILQRLAGWTGMELLIQKEDPSWLEEVMSVNMQNIKLRQALINIVDSVDGQIDINIDNNRIVIYEPVRPRKKESVSDEPKSAGNSGEGYVGKISIPIGEGEDKYFIEFMLRERDLTEELRKLREDKIKEILMKFSEASNNAFEITFQSQPYYSFLN